MVFSSFSVWRGVRDGEWQDGEDVVSVFVMLIAHLPKQCQTDSWLSLPHCTHI